MKIEEKLLKDGFIEIKIYPFNIKTYSKNTKIDIDIAIMEALASYLLYLKEKDKDVKRQISKYYNLKENKNINS